MDLEVPRVMGILNATPDSFYAASRVQTEEAVAGRVQEILDEGADMIDVGACSTRPDSAAVSEPEEMERLRMALAVVRRMAPDAVVSVDTFRPAVARMAVEEFGADMINDVKSSATLNAPLGSAASLCEEPSTLNAQPNEMFRMVARLGVPYILMSQAADMKTMLMELARDVQQLRDYGQKDIIVDPGFGFGKTLDDNYAVMRDLSQLQLLELPVLVGVSRKSMIHRLLDLKPEEALNGTTILNTMALERGAKILRVHDVKEAVECVRIFQKMKK